MLKEKEEIASTAPTNKTIDKICAVIFFFIGVVILSILGIHMILGSESVYFGDGDFINLTLYGGLIALIFSIVTLWRPAFLIISAIGIVMIVLSFLSSGYYVEILDDDICEEWKEGALFTDAESGFDPCKW